MIGNAAADDTSPDYDDIKYISGQLFHPLSFWRKQRCINIVKGYYTFLDLGFTTLYTDTFSSYDHMARIGYKHLRIARDAKEYARGSVHTDNIEGFWSLLKRGIGGVYHSVSEKYLQHNINEYGFRYNHRNDEKLMFETVLEKI
ncbi:transposase [Chloroflexota bacterium]